MRIAANRQFGPGLMKQEARTALGTAVATGVLTAAERRGRSVAIAAAWPGIAASRWSDGPSSRISAPAGADAKSPPISHSIRTRCSLACRKVLQHWHKAYHPASPASGCATMESDLPPWAVNEMPFLRFPAWEGQIRHRMLSLLDAKCTVQRPVCVVDAWSCAGPRAAGTTTGPAIRPPFPKVRAPPPGLDAALRVGTVLRPSPITERRRISAHLCAGSTFGCAAASNTVKLPKRFRCARRQVIAGVSSAGRCRSHRFRTSAHFPRSCAFAWGSRLCEAFGAEGLSAWDVPDDGCVALVIDAATRQDADRPLHRLLGGL